jgi:hypothetical protein
MLWRIGVFANEPRLEQTLEGPLIGTKDESARFEDASLSMAGESRLFLGAEGI